MTKPARLPEVPASTFFKGEMKGSNQRRRDCRTGRTSRLGHRTSRLAASFLDGAIQCMAAMMRQIPVSGEQVFAGTRQPGATCRRSSACHPFRVVRVFRGWNDSRLGVLALHRFAWFAWFAAASSAALSGLEMLLGRVFRGSQPLATLRHILWFASELTISHPVRRG